MTSDESKSKLKEMWEYSFEKVTIKTNFKIASITIVSLLIILYGIFVVYLGVFAHGNPDPSHCYFIDGLENPGLTRSAVNTLA